jgi:hypothetical protein
MARVRSDNDARYALRASLVDENGNVIKGDKIVIPAPAVAASKNVDGGAAATAYLPTQNTDGGTANG